LLDAPGLVIIFFVLAVAAGLLLARWPVAASLGIFAFLLPFDSVLNIGQAGSVHLHFTWFIAALAGGVLLVRGFLGRSFVLPPHTVLWPSLIVFWGVMSVWWAIDPDKALFRLPVLALFLFLYLATACVRMSEKELVLVGWLVILGGCVAAAVSLYELHQGQSFLPSHPNLGTGPEVYELSGRETLALGARETDPNELAASLILPLSLAVGIVLSSGSNIRRFLSMGMVGLIGASLYKTGSRGGMLGATVVFLVYLWRSPMRRRLALPIAVVGSFILARPGMLLSRMGEASADRGSGRLDIWGVGWWALGRYPILGAGLDCFPDVYNQYSYAAANFMGFNRAPHNSYLGTAVELGLVGGFLLLASLTGHYLLTANARRANSDESSRLRLIAYEAAFWGLLVSGLFVDLFWQGYFWFTLMLLVMGAGVARAGIESDNLHPEPFEHPIQLFQFRRESPLSTRNGG
jgi:O-Antigen ligase